MNQDLNKKPLNKKEYFIVSSMLFALFFGAGNLIFPLHLGQMAGSHWFVAMLGFLVTAVALPLLSVLAISVTKSEGVYDIGKPLGHIFALTFMILIHATIGPLFGTPRTATVPFTVGVQPLLPTSWARPGLLIFSALFFIFAFFIAYQESNILNSLGKILNPIFLLLLFSIFLLAFAHPLGAASTQPAVHAYHQAAFFNGFLQGYNTMDALAGLAFGVTVVTAVRQLGKTKPSSNARVTAQAGFLATAAIGILYIGLIWLGATTLAHFKLSADGGVAFNQIVSFYMGGIGHALLATLMTLTCLTTAVGLVAAFAQDFHKHFPQLSYHVWLALMCSVSFITANFGLDTIIEWSTPILMFLYPFAMVLILLSVCSPLFDHDPVVYGLVVGFTTIPALLDMISSFPAVISQSGLGKTLTAFQHSVLPFSAIGMDWVVPALIGTVLGLSYHFLQPVISRVSPSQR
ncbi:branched-chain amino acid transport system II carrier protein [Liquorilactobacillus capillatus]|uniref:Branched-chain amino acid transport system carrier protein n=1 Tax=Liquorilactobacillus capillatus DSM 19910 TaxID=1423731 RepID=A0A0R1MBD1_9LACO|nr:branched-chain amino acid transport system II carrier protein [Liquorilactobacillus capillatus]KRL02418.1 branched chain amino acid ABC superfamily ATP binding cassette transporter carrier protein [Liquorilactobacillus capillatus DSM 19910]